MSLEPMVLEHGFWKFGRFYGNWAPDKYLWPIDREECNRLDMMHKTVTLIRGGKIYQYPYDRKARADGQRAKLMDLGAGSGIWSVGCAEADRDVDVMAVDINRIQPQLIPPNMRTVQVDIESSQWEALYKECDLIYMRMMYGAIQDDKWDGIYQRAFEHVAPGGRFEQVEWDWAPQWNEDVPPENSALKRWYAIFSSSMAKCNRTVEIDSKQVATKLEAAGFVDVEHEAIECETSPWRDGPNRADKYNKARWFNISFDKSVDGMSLWPMIEKASMGLPEVKDLMGEVKAEMCSLKSQAVMTLHIWSGRKPDDE